MNAYQPGDRVIDADNGRRGEVVEDSITTEHPGFIPVRWDNLDRTLAHPSILKHENGAGCSAKNNADTATTETLEKETIMPIIANTTDKDTTSSANIVHAEAQMLANLVSYISETDINPRELGNELFASRGMETINRIFRELRALPESLDAEYRASEETETQA